MKCKSTSNDVPKKKKKRQLKDRRKHENRKGGKEGNKGGRIRQRKEGKSRNDRLTQQWGIERVVLLVAMGTQDTFNLHIWGHEWGRGHLWEKLLPWLLAGCTQRAQVQSVGNIDAHVYTRGKSQSSSSIIKTSTSCQCLTFTIPHQRCADVLLFLNHKNIRIMEVLCLLFLNIGFDFIAVCNFVVIFWQWGISFWQLQLHISLILVRK